jgi:hypothetical protein
MSRALALAMALLAAGPVSARQTAPQQPTLRPSAPAPGAASQTPAPTAPAPAAPVTTPPPINATPVPIPAEPAVVAPVAETAPTAPTAPAKPVEPAKRGRSGVAILQALDKVTTETMRFEVPVGQPIRYKTLIFTVRACETSASDEAIPESAAYVVVDTQPKAVAGRVAPPGRQIYKGWMYASSPGLNPLQHPVYDAWLIACKTSVPVAPAGSR